MTNLKIQSIKRWGPNHKRIALVFLILALFGFMDATYLTIAHYRGGIVPCSDIGDCEKVLTSEFSTVVGLPVAFFGSLYYFFIFLSAFLSMTRKDERFLLAVSALIFLGFLASLWLVYLQLFLIRAICLYCMFSAAITAILFICAISFTVVIWKEKNRAMARSEENIEDTANSI
ncbi:MAG: vitamin K epoxide reductase family protein [Patescibacteria group bacterium]